MKMTEILLEGYQAFNLTSKARRKILARFPPKFPKVIAHHITYKFGVGPNIPLPSNPKLVEVVGYAEGNGIEALVVEVNGSTRRADGGTYHITLSLDPTKGVKPVHSNKVITKGWNKVAPFPIDVTVEFNR